MGRCNTALSQLEALQKLVSTTTATAAGTKEKLKKIALENQSLQSEVASEGVLFQNVNFFFLFFSFSLFSFSLFFLLFSTIK
jgi:hypothetical protein